MCITSALVTALISQECYLPREGRFDRALLFLQYHVTLCVVRVFPYAEVRGRLYLTAVAVSLQVSGVSLVSRDDELGNGC